MTDLSKSVAIVGSAESDQIGLVENKSALQLHAEAAHNALEDAGLTKDDVDGLLQDFRRRPPVSTWESNRITRILRL
jgi:hypothetical protein